MNSWKWCMHERLHLRPAHRLLDTEESQSYTGARLHHISTPDDLLGWLFSWVFFCVLKITLYSLFAQATINVDCNWSCWIFLTLAHLLFWSTKVCVFHEFTSKGSTGAFFEGKNVGGFRQGNSSKDHELRSFRLYLLQTLFFTAQKSWSAGNSNVPYGNALQ